MSGARRTGGLHLGSWSAVPRRRRTWRELLFDILCVFAPALALCLLTLCVFALLYAVYLFDIGLRLLLGGL